MVRLGLLGTLRVEKDGAPLRLRTVQQGLLLAWLSVAKEPLDRTTAACSLWPEAARENALAYLRRGVMELRKAGVEIVASGTRLSLDTGSFESDLRDLLPKIEGVFTLLPSAKVLGNLDHPATDEIRERVREAFHERQRQKAKPAPPEAKGVHDLIQWMWETLLRERSDVASNLLAAHGLELVAAFPSEPLLEVALMVLNAEPPGDRARVTVRQIAARSAHILTRYSLAERLYLEAAADAEEQGSPEAALPVRAQLAFLYMERRRWSESRALFMKCVEQAEALGDPAAIEAAHSNFAGLLWHLCEFEASVNHYRRAIEIASPLKRIVSVANLAYLWGVFGVEPGLDLRTDLAASPTDGYQSVADAYLRFSIAMAEEDAVDAGIGASRLIGLTAKGGLERLFCVAIDCAAMALVRLDRPISAAVCVRIGSRIRRDVDHARSPGEKVAIRRNVPPPYLGDAIQQAMPEFDSSELGAVGKAIVRLLDRPMA